MGAARQFHQQMVHYLRKTVNYNDTGITTGVKMGTLPNGAVVHDAKVLVQTVFNAVTTNVLTVGTNSSTYNNIIAAAGVDESSATLQQSTLASITTGVLAADTDVYVTYTQTGTAATAGKATVLVMYTVDNDG